MELVSRDQERFSAMSTLRNLVLLTISTRDPSMLSRECTPCGFSDVNNRPACLQSEQRWTEYTALRDSSIQCGGAGDAALSPWWEIRKSSCRGSGKDMKICSFYFAFNMTLVGRFKWSHKPEVPLWSHFMYMCELSFGVWVNTAVQQAYHHPNYHFIMFIWIRYMYWISLTTIWFWRTVGFRFLKQDYIIIYSDIISITLFIHEWKDNA